MRPPPVWLDGIGGMVAMRQGLCNQLSSAAQLTTEYEASSEATNNDAKACHPALFSTLVQGLLAALGPRPSVYDHVINPSLLTAGSHDVARAGEGTAWSPVSRV